MRQGWRSVFPPLSADYQAWRQEFLGKRLRLCLWVALPCALTFLILNVYDRCLKGAQVIKPHMLVNLGSVEAVVLMQTLNVINIALIVVLLVGCLWLQQIPWGRRHPGRVLLLFSKNQPII